MSDEGDILIGSEVLTSQGPGYVETLGRDDLYVVDLYDSKRSLYMRRDEVLDAIDAHEHDTQISREAMLAANPPKEER